MSREYSRSHEGLITVIIDSYNKAKLSLPRWPFGRVPKKSIYEETRRSLTIFETFQTTLSILYLWFKGLKMFKPPRNLLDVDSGYMPRLGVLHVLIQRSTDGRIKLELGMCPLDWFPNACCLFVFSQTSFCMLYVSPTSQISFVYFQWVSCIVRWCDRWMKFTCDQVSLQNHFPLSSLATVWGLFVLVSLCFWIWVFHFVFFCCLL